jgi:transposase
MYIQRIHKKQNGKIYTSTVLMESYREGKIVKHRIIHNISKFPPHLISAIEKALKEKEFQTIEDLQLSAGKSIGAIFTVKEIAKRLGIAQALGNSKNGLLALFQIAGRIIAQGSRNYLANEWSLGQAIDKVFKINKISEDDLYENLDWLSKNQKKIEEKIFRHRHESQGIKSLFLYDVSSSYLEGDKNELAAFGYNRDKKKGKKQIVIGLLTDSEGYPVATEVFAGNTSDTLTVASQLKKLKERFGVERLVFVGDKGMIKSAQIDALHHNDYQWNYLTSITKEQIRKLMSRNIIQLELFENELVEVEDSDGVRYILRRNPARAKMVRETRQSQLAKIAALTEKNNLYLQEHPRAKIETAQRKVQAWIDRFKFNKYVTCTQEGGRLVIKIDSDNLVDLEKLDGCYVIKTDVPKAELDTPTAHARYKDLAMVEIAFRTFKTGLEEIRPIYVRKEHRTRGHVFVVMLAYMIIKYITDQLSNETYTRKFIIESLDKIHYLQYTFEGKILDVLPKNLLVHQKAILDKLGIQLK